MVRMSTFTDVRDETYDIISKLGKDRFALIFCKWPHSL